VAILRGPPNPLEVARFKGIVHYTKDRGLHVVKTWPRKRGQKATPAQQQARADFKRMVAAVNDCRPEDKAIARELAKGTGYTWRDILSAAVTGELLILEGVNTVQIQTELDKITNVVGALIVRTELGWVGLLPGAAGRVLTMPVGGTVPDWESPSSPGAGGLFSQLLSAPPTATSSGFTTWYNQGGAIVSDAPDGIELSAAIGSGGNHNLRGRHQAAPATPYTKTFLMYGSSNTNYAGMGVGWSDGAKAHSLYLQSDLFAEAKWSTFTAFSFTTLAAGVTLFTRPLIFFRLTDDGTTVTAEYSFTGNSWRTGFTTTKSAGYLGASGYSQLVFFINNYSAGVDCTILRYN